jgi:flagellar basal body-associated protein FliL
MGKKAATEEGGEQKGEQKGKGKMIGIIAAVAVVAVIGAKFTVLSGGKSKVTPDPVPTLGQVIDLGNVTINLASDPSPHYAEVGLALEVSLKANADTLTADMPLLENAAVEQLSGMTETQVLAPGGQTLIRSELTTAAQAIFGKTIVQQVLLTELVVQ